MVGKIASSQADCICLDLEDAVPFDSKQKARELIRNHLNSELVQVDRTFVRVNPIESGMTLLDVDSTASPNLRGYIYPMAKTADDIVAFDAQLSLIESQHGIPKHHFAIIPLIETPSAVENLHAIANASSRIVGLLFGCEDYLAEIGGYHSDEEWALLYPRSKIVNVAKSLGILAIDTPFVDVKNLDKLSIFSSRAKSLGMDGMLVLSPSQVEVANRVYTPTMSEIDAANRIVEAKVEAQKQGLGVIIVGGEFVSPPTIKAAINLLDLYNRITHWSDK